MATKSDCLPPVILGDITITKELLEQLNLLKEQGLDGLHFFAEEVMLLATVDFDHYGLDKGLIDLLRTQFLVMRALIKPGEGGVR